VPHRLGLVVRLGIALHAGVTPLSHRHLSQQPISRRGHVSPDSCCPAHPSGLSRTRVMTLAAIYHYHSGRLLSLNDASLPYGGVIAYFDSKGRDAHCHGSHRQGIDIDIDRVDMGGRDMTAEIMEKTSRTLLEFMEQFVLHVFDGSLPYTYRTVVIDGIPVRRLLSIHWRLP
jgi:hypothetical protein